MPIISIEYPDVNTCFHENCDIVHYQFALDTQNKQCDNTVMKKGAVLMTERNVITQKNS